MADHTLLPVRVRMDARGRQGSVRLRAAGQPQRVTVDGREAVVVVPTHELIGARCRAMRPTCTSFFPGRS